MSLRGCACTSCYLHYWDTTCGKCKCHLFNFLFFLITGLVCINSLNYYYFFVIKYSFLVAALIKPALIIFNYLPHDLSVPVKWVYHIVTLKLWTCGIVLWVEYQCIHRLDIFFYRIRRKCAILYHNETMTWIIHGLLKLTTISSIAIEAISAVTSSSTTIATTCSKCSRGGRNFMVFFGVLYFTKKLHIHMSDNWHFYNFPQLHSTVNRSSAILDMGVI